MIRFAGVLIIALVFSLGWQSLRLSGVRADLDRAEAALAGYRDADRWRVKEEARRAASAVVDRQLQEEPGNDAPLSDYLRRGVGRVWP